METTPRFELTEDEYIMELICKIFGHMDAEDKATWSLENAIEMVACQIKIDREAGREPQAYDPEDFFETIRDLIELEIEEDSEL